MGMEQQGYGLTVDQVNIALSTNPQLAGLITSQVRLVEQQQRATAMVTQAGQQWGNTYGQAAQPVYGVPAATQNAPVANQITPQPAQAVQQTQEATMAQQNPLMAIAQPYIAQVQDFFTGTEKRFEVLDNNVRAVRGEIENTIKNEIAAQRAGIVNELRGEISALNDKLDVLIKAGGGAGRNARKADAE